MRRRIFTAALIAVLFCVAALTASAAETSVRFSDVKETDWFADAVYTAAGMGLINGKGKDASGEDRFDPEGSITLAEAVKLAACMSQLYADGAVTLTNGDPWYESYADYGRSRFLADSWPGFTYESVLEDPGRVLLRAEFAWIFARALPSEALTQINDIPDDAVPDMKKDEKNLSDRMARLMTYYPEVYALYRAGIINGSDKAGTFLPESNIRRSEVAAIVVRMMRPETRVGAPENLKGPSSGYTLHEIYEANLLSNIMKRHSSVSLLTPGESDRVTTCWIKDGTAVSATVWDDTENGVTTREERGSCGDFEYYVASDGSVKANLWVSGSGRRPMDDVIASTFPEELTEEIRLLSDDGDTVTLFIRGLFLSGPKKEPGEMTVILDKNTLELLSAQESWTSGTYTYSSEHGYVYDRETAGLKIAEGWDRTRTITYVIMNGGQQARTETVVCPASWDLTLAAVPGYRIEAEAPGAELLERGEYHVPPGDGDIRVVVN